MTAYSEEMWEDEPRRRVPVFCRIYGFVALLLLLWPASGGMYLLGSTRVWGWSIGLVLAFAGCALVFLRPVLFPAEDFEWRIPLLWLGMLAATVFVGTTVPRAFVPDAARWEGLKWLCLCMAGLAWSQCAGKGEQWKFFVFLLLLALSVECFYAISKHIDHSRMVLWMERPAQYVMRASGTYLCPNHLANVLAMGMPLAILLLVSGVSGAPLRLMAVYYLAVAAPVLYWTQSRSGWGGALAGVSAAVLLAAWRKSVKALAVALVALPLVACALGYGAWKALPAVRERIGAVLEDPVKAGGIRAKMWADVPSMVRDKPDGFGGGSFQWAYPPYREHTTQILTYDQLHNDPLQMLVEYGWAGLAAAAGLYLWAMGLFAARSVRARDEAAALLDMAAVGALAASGLHSLFDFNFHIFPNPHVLVLLCGVALGRSAGREGTGWTVRSRLAGSGLSVLAVAVCLAGLWFSLAGGKSYWWTLKGEAFASASEYSAAENAYRRAVRWNPRNWQPWLGLGDLKSSQGFWFRAPDKDVQARGKRALGEEARAAYEEASRLNPGDMSVEYGLARAENAAGNEEAALEHCRKAAAYQHKHTFYREQLGLQLNRMGREDEALEIFRQCIKDGVASETSYLNVRRLERKAAKRAREDASAMPDASAQTGP